MSRLIPSLAASFAFLLLAPLAMAADKETPAPLDFKMKSLQGKQVDLADYAGKTVLIVNVASECGATPQYEGLEALYDKYQDKGLVVLGFPCNQFGGQEPGTATEIAKFCKSQYDVSFPMFAKIEVNGPKAAPLYQYLTQQETTPAGSGKIGWNFEKFLIGKDGAVIGRYATGVEPDDEKIVSAIEADLAK